MKKLLRLLGINLLVFFYLVEMISAGIYFVQHGALFYTQRDVGVPQQYAEPQSNPQLTEERLHPFFGLTYQPDLKKGINNYGFFCNEDFPFHRERPTQFIVGIFGGSVAHGFSEQGRDRLVADLRRLPFLAQREIVFLNFAIGGYKQPQQLQVLSYFLAVGQELDMAINIDGFNEVVFCLKNNRMNVDLAMPSAQLILPMWYLLDQRAISPQRLQTLWEIQQIRARLRKVEEYLPRVRLASWFVILSSYHRYLKQRYDDAVFRFDQLIEPHAMTETLLNVKYSPEIPEDAHLFQQIADLWIRSSILMNAMLAARDIPYFHFLQPNQYYSKKVFSQDEKEKSQNERLAYGRSVTVGYPYLEAGIDVLRKNGVKAYSAVGVFDQLSEPVYVDECCHFSRLGNEILADFIAASIAEDLEAEMSRSQ